MSSSKQTQRNEANELNGDSHQIVEEKIVKATGETMIRKYSKGRFLGKV